MMSYPFIVESIPLQYRRNNRIASCCNYRSENFQYRPTLLKGTTFANIPVRVRLIHTLSLSSYVENLLCTITERWDEISYGAGKRKPSKRQSRLFIYCINALGYYSTRCKKHLAPTVPRLIINNE